MKIELAPFETCGNTDCPHANSGDSRCYGLKEGRDTFFVCEMLVHDTEDYKWQDKDTTTTAT